MISAIALDDEPLAIDVIKNYCQKVDEVKLMATFTEPGTAMKYLEQHPVDLLFLDINMPAISGIDFYKKVSKNTMVIFTTAYSEFAVEGFNLNAVDYLLKPFDFKRFQQAVDKIKEYHNYVQLKENEQPQYLFVKVDYSMVKVPFEEIAYIEGLDNYLKINFDSGKSLLVRMSMKTISEKLPASEFIRVHRSFIIPFSKVLSVRNKTIYLDKKEIPIGTNYVDEIMKLFKEI
ncbi:MAG: DNA-binding response regulator [Flavipsychrobacter sp.]|jgi:DNA-binding LytR/AlgR family response regulator|nr:DNA-binding response regulator [Flavipsychrobacter sp.]